MYDAWLKGNCNVHSSWNAFFTNLTNEYPIDQCFAVPPALLSKEKSHGTSQIPSEHDAHSRLKLSQLIQAYQKRGHEFALINPLKLEEHEPYIRPAMVEARKRSLHFTTFGFTEADLDEPMSLNFQSARGFSGPHFPALPLRQIIERLEETYCGTVAVQADHLTDPSMINFLHERIETPERFHFDAVLKKRILKRIIRACMFETFCGTKFSTSKRFGIDGCEAAIATLKAITKKAVHESVDAVLIGMAHRGRLNVLTNVLHKNMRQMINEFQGVTGFGGRDWGNTGDVKYHLGVDYDHFDLDAERIIHLSVAANPSHLEAINAVILGKCRAKQYYTQDSLRSKVIPILIHGDASISGQGVIYECLQMSQLPNYKVGGTIHIVVNNQVGFTTNVIDQSSGQHCSDIAKFLDTPIFHVNADDPEACTFIANLALDFRQNFKSDVFINIIGYRRYGHNELDMPKFTQPMMYNVIEKHPNVMEIYAEKLKREGIVSDAEVDKMKAECVQYYNDQFEESKKGKHIIPFQYRQQWKSMALPIETCPPKPTGVKLDTLQSIGLEICTIPEGKISAHPTLKRIYKTRYEAISNGKNIDFGLAEALAFSSLLNEGYHIRLAGQDVQRGTFSHRHSVLNDQKQHRSYTPIKELAQARALPHTIEICNSPLNEYASLCFEIGYAFEHPDTLSIWEAQFGDFANGAQVAIDQFIVSGETKWGSQCGITLLLPHGYDGQGPEHSSARIERFLQLCDDREDVIHPDSWNVYKRSVIQQHNIQVVNCTTPANFFHMLRRQLHRGFRKPLVCISAKRMLKQRVTFSRIEEFENDTSFIRYYPNMAHSLSETPVITDHIVNEMLKKTVMATERLILCSGQVYYDLAAYRDQHKIENIAIARVEQLSPFPFDRVIDDIRRYPDLKSIVWAQEEPMNTGPWAYASKRIRSCLKFLNWPNGIRYPIYVGRDVGAAPAGGDTKLHEEELANLLNDAFSLDRKTNSYHEKYYLRSVAEPSMISEESKKKRSVFS